MLRFILSTLALFGTAIFAFIFEGGTFLDLFLPSPLIIVACVSGFAVLAVWSVKDWGRAWKDAFAKETGEASAATSASLWAFYEKACYAAGVVGFLLGLNIIGTSIPDNGMLARSLAVNCVTPILAILFAMVARILRARVESQR
jgi:flagellar motor component MotA